MNDRYINFFPGDMREDREIMISNEPFYGMSPDLGCFLGSIVRGCTDSFPADGVRESIEDGELLGQILGSSMGMTETELQEAIEELAEAFRVDDRTRETFPA